MDYEYTALENDGDVRFIRLLPSYFSQDDAPLQIELVTGRLGDPASNAPCSHVYEALSYAWEGQTPDRTVLCQGRRLLVTANCEAAMRQLRRRTRVRLLWIDAICIDQASIQDKSRQVRRMGDIYQQAQRVVVWLGEGSPDILRLFRNLRLFAHLKRIPWYPLARRLQRKLALRIDQSQKLDATQIAQLPREGLFVMIPRTGSSLGQRAESRRPVEIHREIARRIGEVRKEQFGADPERRLAEILNSARTKHVTEPRDRIYALQGICALGVRLPPPDYGKSVWEVFCDAVVMVIRTDQAFTILEQSPVEFELLEGNKLRVWGKVIDTITEVTPSLEAAGFLNAAPTDAQTYLEGIRSGVEFVQALNQWLWLGLSDPDEDMEDTFVTLLRALLYTDLPLDNHAEEFYNWLRVLLLMKQKATGTELPPAADGRTRFCQWLRGLSGEPANDVQKADPADRGDTSQNKQDGAAESTKRVDGPSQPDAAARHPNSDQVAALASFYDYDNPELKRLCETVEFHQLRFLLGSNKAAHRFHKYFLRGQPHRRLFWTSRGRLGNGCDAVVPGDQVVLISGARQPFVVREKGDGTFTLVGPAYVSGDVMYGAAWVDDWSRESGQDSIDLV
ncbi:hypothetical protein NEMBOFW57_007806 [Staphylotrichum longicolle]|uniref:Heterokaryon incompatibility domain-containing protein n=1 Tax=Staphylotrichum longicolle TaxID=669026 RepID=A0AAD4EW44_9PEZI|nr:hypothetical protein NEMBOFW57_007806 [Staphylotrichum longicolle]